MQNNTSVELYNLRDTPGNILDAYHCFIIYIHIMFYPFFSFEKDIMFYLIGNKWYTFIILHKIIIKLQ